MSTRDEMRRELKELANLATRIKSEPPAAPAQAIPREAWGLPPTDSRMRVQPTVAPAPPRPLSIRTPPPIVLTAPASSAETEGPLGRLPAILAGLGLAVAMVGGLAAGRSLAEGAWKTSASASPRVGSEAAPPAAEAPPVHATVIAVEDSARPSPPGPTSVAGTPTPISAGVTSGTSGAPLVIAATRVASFSAPPRRPIPHFGRAKAASAPSAIVDGRPPASHDSLEDLMRRSVSASAKR